MNERAQPKQSGHARFVHFESIWNNTQGSDFEKTCAMLEDYSGFLSWGTYKDEVKEVLQAYSSQNGYVKTVENKNSLIFSIEFLLFQLSEKISFSEIKPTGDLAALFNVIMSKSGLVYNRFDREARLYSFYKRHNNQIKDAMAKTDKWKEVISFCEDLDAEEIQYLTAAFYEEKLIEYVDKCNLLFSSMGGHVVLDYLLSLGLEKSHVGDEDLSKLFRLAIEKRQYVFAQDIFIKKYNLDGTRKQYYDFNGRESDKVIILLNALSKLINKNVNADFLSIMTQYLMDCLQTEKSLEVMADGSMQVKKNCVSCYSAEAIMALICKNRFITQGDEVIENLITWFNPNLEVILGRAISDQSSERVQYLLENKKFNLDLKARHLFLYTDKVGRTQLQHAIWNICVSTDFRNFSFLCDTVSRLVSYDPDCVRIKDSNGKDIFWYLSELRNKKLNSNDEFYENRLGIFEEIHSVIGKVFRESAFAFYRGFFDRKSGISMLDKDVVTRISLGASGLTPR